MCTANKVIQQSGPFLRTLSSGGAEHKLDGVQPALTTFCPCLPTTDTRVVCSSLREQEATGEKSEEETGMCRHNTITVKIFPCRTSPRDGNLSCVKDRELKPFLE